MGSKVSHVPSDPGKVRQRTMSLNNHRRLSTSDTWGAFPSFLPIRDTVVETTTAASSGALASHPSPCIRRLPSPPKYNSLFWNRKSLAQSTNTNQHILHFPCRRLLTLSVCSDHKQRSSDVASAPRFCVKDPPTSKLYSESHSRKPIRKTLPLPLSDQWQRSWDGAWQLPKRVRSWS